MSQKETVALTYKGAKHWDDNLYGTGLDFDPGQTRQVPTEVADKFRRHADVFDVGAKAAKTDDKAEKANATDKDDTAQKLDAAKKAKDKEVERENRYHDTMASLERMDAKQLVAYAKTQFNHTIHPNTGKAKALAEVKMMVDKVGVE